MSILEPVRRCSFSLEKEDEMTPQLLGQHDMETTLLHVGQEGLVVPTTSGPERAYTEVAGQQAWEGR